MSNSDAIKIERSLVQMKIMNDKHGQTGKKTGMSFHKAILQHNSLKTEVTHKTLVRSNYSQLKFKREPTDCEIIDRCSGVL